MNIEIFQFKIKGKQKKLKAFHSLPSLRRGSNFFENSHSGKKFLLFIKGILTFSN